MRTTDVLIIGGSAAGMVAALTGKSSWPKKSFILVKKQKEMMVPCGIPYTFGTLDCSDQNIMPVDAMLEKNGIISLVDEVTSINKEDNSVTPESRTREEGIDSITGTFEGMDRHPGNLPDAHKQLVKLIAARHSGVIIGGEVIGGSSAGELTNVIGLIIQNRMSVNSLLTSQIGTHPCLTASPAGYPLIKAAEIIAGKMRSR